MKTHQIHKSVDNFRFNLRVEENQALFFCVAFRSTEEGKKNQRLHAHDIYYSIYERIFFCWAPICTKAKSIQAEKKPDQTFSDLSNDCLNKFVLAHVHVDFAPLQIFGDFR